MTARGNCAKFCSDVWECKLYLYEGLGIEEEGLKLKWTNSPLPLDRGGDCMVNYLKVLPTIWRLLKLPPMRYTRMTPIKPKKDTYNKSLFPLQYPVYNSNKSCWIVLVDLIQLIH